MLHTNIFIVATSLHKRGRLILEPCQ